MKGATDAPPCRIGDGINHDKVGGAEPRLVAVETGAGNAGGARSMFMPSPVLDLIADADDWYARMHPPAPQRYTSQGGCRPVRRRASVLALGAATIAWPLSTFGQDPRRKYKLGFLLPTSRDSPAVAAFFDELRAAGFVEGQNLSVVEGGFDVRNDQIVERAAAVVRALPDAIVSGPDFTTRALQHATRTIPLIAMTEDMAAAGPTVFKAWRQYTTACITRA